MLNRLRAYFLLLEHSTPRMWRLEVGGKATMELWIWLLYFKQLKVLWLEVPEEWVCVIENLEFLFFTLFKC